MKSFLPTWIVVLLCLLVTGVGVGLALLLSDSFPFPSSHSLASPPPQLPGTPSPGDDSFEDVLTDQEYLAILEKYAHPDDLQAPSDSFPPVPDDLIVQLIPPEDAEFFISQYMKILKDPSNRASAYHKFCFGRAAYVLGYERIGAYWMKKASQEGHHYSNAYLAGVYRGYYLQKESDEFFMRAKSVSIDQETLGRLGLFAPLASESHSSGTPQNPSDFNHRIMATAFFNDDKNYFASLSGQDRQDAMVYTAALHKALWDINNLFLTQKPSFMLELDPKTETKLSMVRTLESDAILQDGTNTLVAGLSMVGPVLEAIGEGKGIVDEYEEGKEIEALVKSAVVLSEAAEGTRKAQFQFEIRYVELGKAGEQDAWRLVTIYDTDPELFRRYYKGIKSFTSVVSN